MMSWNNVSNNKLRYFLTVLGIVVGVVAIVALITIVQGVTREITGSFKDLGVNKLTIQAYGTPLKMGLNSSDIEKLSQIDGILGMSPTVSTMMPIVADGKKADDMIIHGKNEMYFKNEPDIVLRGRAINVLDVQNKNRVCLINEELEDELFFGTNAIGKKLIIGGISYDIVGILKKSLGFSLLSIYDSCSVVIPYVNAMKFAGEGNVSSLDIYMADSNSADSITTSIQTVLDQAFNYKSGSYYIMNMNDLLNVMNEVVGMMTLLLGGIASIALLVGGIGIMNMMLISVTERTPEIGLRKALGARPNDIRAQFLIESTLLSVFGGIIGLIIGLLIAFLFSRIADFEFFISFKAVLLALVFSSIVGILFGFMPAGKASKLNPVDALRNI